MPFLIPFSNLFWVESASYNNILNYVISFEYIALPDYAFQIGFLKEELISTKKAFFPKDFIKWKVCSISHLVKVTNSMLKLWLKAYSLVSPFGRSVNQHFWKSIAVALILQIWFGRITLVTSGADPGGLDWVASPPPALGVQSP